MCNAGMCAYVGVCHAMSPLVGYVCIWGVCMGMCACVGVCHAMSVFAAAKLPNDLGGRSDRSEEHTSELQSLMRISYAVFCLKKKNTKYQTTVKHYTTMYQYSNSNILKLQ